MVGLQSGVHKDQLEMRTTEQYTEKGGTSTEIRISSKPANKIASKVVASETAVETAVKTAKDNHPKDSEHNTNNREGQGKNRQGGKAE